MAAEQDAVRAQRESEQAHEIARLREDQARLARDVHDVVGHSLAVILAQAESAQYLSRTSTPSAEADDGDDRRRRRAARCRTSGRCSAAPADQPMPTRARRLDSLVEGVRAGGHEVESVARSARPSRSRPSSTWSPFRVLQEMLTNAIKHGRRGGPVARRPALATASCAMRGPQHRPEPRRRDHDRRPRPRRATPGRASTACVAGSSRSAVGSTYAVAPSRRADVHRDRVDPSAVGADSG